MYPYSLDREHGFRLRLPTVFPKQDGGQRERGARGGGGSYRLCKDAVLSQCSGPARSYPDRQGSIGRWKLLIFLFLLDTFATNTRRRTRRRRIVGEKESRTAAISFLSKSPCGAGLSGTPCMLLLCLSAQTSST